MVDRLPTYPGRVKLTPVAGTTDKFDLEMADEPSVDGTPLNKATLLTDATAAKYGFTAQDNPTPNDIFNAALDKVPMVRLENAYTARYELTHKTATLPSATYVLAGASVGDYALFAGGMLGSTAVTTVNAYNASLTRTSVMGLSVARYRLCGAGNGTYAIFAGGLNINSAIVNTVDAYNTSLTRSSATALSTARQLLAGASIGGHAIFANGALQNKNPTNAIDTYDTTLTKGAARTSNYSRYDLAGTSNNSYAIFAGGTPSDSAGTGVEAFNASLSISVKTLNVARYMLAGVRAGDYALFGGGYNKNGTKIDTVETFDDALTRGSAENMSLARTLSAGASSNGTAVIAGGQSSSGAANNVDCYSHSLSHSVGEPLSVARHFYNYGGAVAGNLSVFAGGRGDTDSNAVDGYSAVPEYLLELSIPPLSKYKINGITGSEQVTLDGEDISYRSASPFNGYIKRGFTLTGQISQS